MLHPTSQTFRIFVHVLAATIWVGGQFTLAGIVPVLRREHPESTRSVARAFAGLAWPSFIVLVITGIWNVMEVRLDQADWRYVATVIVHIGSATLAALLTVVHSFGRSRIALALGGAFGALFSVTALFIGILLRTGS